MDVKGDQGTHGFMFMEDQAGLIPLNRMEEEYQTFIDENVNYLAYCPKCVRKIPLVDPSFFSIESGKLNAQGYCPYCHSKLSYLLKAYEEQQAVLEEKVEEQPPENYYYLRPVYDAPREESWEAVDEEPIVDEKVEDSDHFVDLKTEYLAYCFGCKKEIAIVEPKFSFLEIDRAIISGFCPFCFSTVSRLLSSYRSTEDLDLNITDGELEDLLKEEDVENEGNCIQPEDDYEEPEEDIENVEEAVREEEVEVEDGDVEVSATISALLEDIKEKVKGEKETLKESSEEEESLDIPKPASVDETSLEALKWEILRTRIKGVQEKLVPEVVPSYFKKRILKDLDTYADFNLMIPFSTIDGFMCSHETLSPMESEPKEDVIPILSIIAEVEVPPEIVLPEEPEEEVEEEEAPSLHDLLDGMIEESEVEEEVEEEIVEVEHQANIDHTDAIIQQCRSCKDHFCEECATHIRSLEGYGNLSEEMFREYFEPLCLNCWKKFQKRFDDAQKGLERKKALSKKPSSDLLERELYDMSIEEGWKRRKRMYQESRRKSTVVHKKKKESMRERVELLRKIRDIRFRVKKGEESKEEIKVEEPKEEIIEEEVIVEEVIVEEPRYVEEEEIVVEEEEMEVPEDEGIGKKMINSIGMRLNLIPAGTFNMGSDKWNETRPVHRVRIPRPFFISVFPVTQREWNEIMEKNPSFPTGDYLPVVNVSWNDSKAFIKELNRKENTNKYRLPTEAEWEYAARAGSLDRFSFGDNEDLLPLHAWTGEDWDVGQLHPVGLKRPNNWGLYDVHGNIWEWVEDKWHDNYSGATTDGSSWEVGRIPTRVRRGGTWSNIIEECETAYRNRNAPGYRYRFLGFRVVREF